MPLAPRRASGRSVRTMIIITSAVAPLVAHALVPFSTQPSPARTACERIPAGSEPASGSESAKAASTSPRAMGRSQRAFCASVPWRISMVAGMAQWMLSDTATLASAAAISSSAIRYVV